MYDRGKGLGGVGTEAERCKPLPVLALSPRQRWGEGEGIVCPSEGLTLSDHPS